VSLFVIRKRNVLTVDPTAPDFLIDTGERISKGADVDVAYNGKVLHVDMNYSFTDAYVSRDVFLPEGQRLPGVPKHFLSIWASASRNIGSSAVDLGLGVVASSRVQASLPNNGFTLAGYSRVDASMGVRVGEKGRLQLNLYNLFDRRIYDTDGFYVLPERPRWAEITYSLKF
jgi:iron complex outermembrane receptor protein